MSTLNYCTIFIPDKCTIMSTPPTCSILGILSTKDDAYSIYSRHMYICFILYDLAFSLGFISLEFWMNNQSPSIQLISHDSLLSHSIPCFRVDARDACVFHRLHYPFLEMGHQWPYRMQLSVFQIGILELVSECVG